MKKAFYIMLKEAKDFFQDKGDLAFSILLPVLIFGLIYGAFGSNLQFTATAHIVNEDSGQYSTQLLEILQSNDGISLELLTREEADTRLERSAILMAAYIPKDFSSKLAAGQPVQIIFKQRGNGDTADQIVFSLIQGAANKLDGNLQVLNQVQADLAGHNIHPQQIAVVVDQIQAEGQQNPAVAIKETNFGSQPDPVNQFLPGIMTMFVLFAVNLTAQALVDERRKGTLERLLTTRLKIGELFIGKFMAYTARGFIQTVLLMLLAYAVFQVFTPLSFLQAIVMALLFASACSTIGLIIGSLCKTQNQATWISVFFTMLMVMLSGTFVAVSEGTILGTLSHFSINTYANDAFRALITRGGSLADITSEIMVRVGVTVVGLIISRFLFRATQGGK